MGVEQEVGGQFDPAEIAINEQQGRPDLAHEARLRDWGVQRDVTNRRPETFKFQGESIRSVTLGSADAARRGKNALGNFGPIQNGVARRPHTGTQRPK